MSSALTKTFAFNLTTAFNLTSVGFVDTALGPLFPTHKLIPGAQSGEESQDRELQLKLFGFLGLGERKL
jgi:hypothetical protein